MPRLKKRAELGAALGNAVGVNGKRKTGDEVERQGYQRYADVPRRAGKVVKLSEEVLCCVESGLEGGGCGKIPS